MEEILKKIDEIEEWYCNMNQTEYMCRRLQNSIEEAQIERLVKELCKLCKEKLNS